MAGQRGAGLRAGILFGLVAVWLAAGACSSSKSSTDAGTGVGGTGGTSGAGGIGGAPHPTDGGSDASADAGSSADAGASTCEQVRLCAFNCGNSASCVATCRQRGSAAAQAAFDGVTMCTQGAVDAGGGGCPPVSDPGYRNCLCLAQCLQDPPCAATLDPCLGPLLDDAVCDACDS